MRSNLTLVTVMCALASVLLGCSGGSSGPPLPPPVSYFDITLHRGETIDEVYGLSNFTVGVDPPGIVWTNFSEGWHTHLQVGDFVDSLMYEAQIVHAVPADGYIVVRVYDI